MPIHLAYTVLFSYFCVAYENSKFRYYIFSHNFFCVRTVPCTNLHDKRTTKCNTRKTWGKQAYTLLLFRVVAFCDTWKCGLYAKCTGAFVFHILPSLSTKFMVAYFCIFENKCIFLVIFYELFQRWVNDFTHTVWGNTERGYFSENLYIATWLKA